MIQIDGSQGGGQILRSSLTLSLMTGHSCDLLVQLVWFLFELLRYKRRCVVHASTYFCEAFDVLAVPQHTLHGCERALEEKSASEYQEW